METRRDVFHAIADPTRRQIIGMIAQQSLNVNTIAENFNVSRQAISLHVKVLEECGLIDIKQIGRERYCEAKLEKLNEVHTWTEQYQKFWTKKLQDLKSFLEIDASPVAKTSANTKKSKSNIKAKRK